MQMADRHTHSLPSPKLNQQAQDSPSCSGEARLAVSDAANSVQIKLCGGEGSGDPTNEGAGAGGRSMKGGGGGPAGGWRRPERAGGRRRWWRRLRAATLDDLVGGSTVGGRKRRRRLGKEAAALWAERIRSGRNGGEQRGDGTEWRGQMQKAQGTVG